MSSSLAAPTDLLSKAPAEPVLELRRICRRFGEDPAVHALVDVDLVVRRGDWLSITGPSGSGKSTLLNVLGCLDRPTSGAYLVDGIEVAALSDRQRAGLRSRRIGFVFQAFHLMSYRTVVENVMLAEVYRGQPRQGRRRRALEALDKVGLGDRVNFLPSKLSGGQKQRVAIARALVGNPAILLCDEPTGNLDSNASAAVLDLFAKLNDDGFTLVVVTHDEAVAARAGRRAHMIDGVLSDLGAARAAPPKSTQSVPALAPPAPTAARSRKTAHRVRPSALSLRDLLDEALSGMFARPGRMTLTILGVVIGLTALVATVGLTRTASNRVISQFDQLAATELFVAARPGRATGVVDPAALPWTASERLSRLDGVVAVGTMSEVDVGASLASASPVNDPLDPRAVRAAVFAVSPGLFDAVRAELRTGRLFDAGHTLRADPVVVLGPDAAARLGIERVDRPTAISIGDGLYTVTGILDDVARRPELLGAVLMPEGTARRTFGLPGPGLVVIETELGAAYLIAEQAPLALRPDDPRALRVEIPQEPRRVRDDVQSDLDVMFLLLGGLSLVVGALGIANITLVGVMERTPEIGLRRAIGATRLHIGAQFLLESAMMGLIGGIIGASCGVLIVVGVAAHQVWTPVLDPAAPLLAPVIGALIGLASGTYPSLRAAQLEPAEAFRR